MPVSLFVSHLGITDLLNKIKIYTNFIKLFHFEIYIILFLFKSSNNVWEYNSGIIDRRFRLTTHPNPTQIKQQIPLLSFINQIRFRLQTSTIVHTPNSMQ